ncbi:Vms1/Ankzf1 family peptidyl-tRNA hydrolase [Curtobacterium pusillum]|uniref:baeRF2 domain-containing protein n=1 Tax=Curtobacterium pusillum TaxID=69373 RepID=UPI0011A6726D|nr:Vms1/Ankzf1 family peptidyl-tRNA hydrolase [Curtobacterium pusillum]
MTSTNATSELHGILGQRLEGGGTWAWAYADVSGNVEDPRRQAALKLRAVETALRGQGAADDVVDLIAGEFEQEPGVPSPVTRYVLVHDGELVLSEVLPGQLHGPEAVGVGHVPDLVPLVAHRPVDLPFLVVHAAKEGGTFRTYRLGHAPGATDDRVVEGRTDTLHYAKAGTGWKQPHWQAHTEEIWKQTSGEVAAAIDETVRSLRPGLVVVAGDVTARELLVKTLSAETRALTSVFPGDPRADAGSKQAFVEHVETALARVVATRRHDLEDLLRTHAGRGDNLAVTGLGAVVAALQQAQGAVVALDAVAVGERTLLALAGAPWVATAPEQAAGTPVIGAVPAVCALVRAAVLTDAELVLVNAASLPGGAAAAALLRWPVGPAVPA